MIWESDHYAANSRGPKSNYSKLLANAEAIREQLLLKVLGV